MKFFILQLNDLNSVKMLPGHNNQTKATEDRAADIRLGTIHSNNFLMWHYLDLVLNIFDSILLRVVLAYHGTLLVLEK